MRLLALLLSYYSRYPQMRCDSTPNDPGFQYVGVLLKS